MFELCRHPQTRRLQRKNGVSGAELLVCELRNLNKPSCVSTKRLVLKVIPHHLGDSPSTREGTKPSAHTVEKGVLVDINRLFKSCNSGHVVTLFGWAVYEPLCLALRSAKVQTRGDSVAMRTLRHGRHVRLILSPGLTGAPMKSFGAHTRDRRPMALTLVPSVLRHAHAPAAAYTQGGGH